MRCSRLWGAPVLGLRAGGASDKTTIAAAKLQAASRAALKPCVAALMGASGGFLVAEFLLRRNRSFAVSIVRSSGVDRVRHAPLTLSPKLRATCESAICELRSAARISSRFWRYSV